MSKYDPKNLDPNFVKKLGNKFQKELAKKDPFRIVSEDIGYAAPLAGALAGGYAYHLGRGKPKNPTVQESYNTGLASLTGASLASLGALFKTFGLTKRNSLVRSYHSELERIKNFHRDAIKDLRSNTKEAILKEPSKKTSIQEQSDASFRKLHAFNEKRENKLYKDFLSLKNQNRKIGKGFEGTFKTLAYGATPAGAFYIANKRKGVEK